MCLLPPKKDIWIYRLEEFQSLVVSAPHMTSLVFCKFLRNNKFFPSHLLGVPLDIHYDLKLEWFCIVG